MSKNSDGAQACVEALAADFHDHAAKIRSMANGRKPNIQARLQTIAQALEDRGSTLLKRTGA